MNFNTVGTLLAVSSAHDTVHIFKLGTHGAGSGNGGSAGQRGEDASDVASQESRDIEGPGYDAVMDGKKSNGGLSYVFSLSLLVQVKLTSGWLVPCSRYDCD